MFETTPDKIPEGLANVIISAIGQKPNLEDFSELKLSEWGTIISNPETFQTNLDGVFAIGDATNQGTDIAVRAIGEGRKCAESVDNFLNGKSDEVGKTNWFAKSEKTAEDFADYKKQSKIAPLTEKSAKSEALRCLECGCNAFTERRCKLLKYANMYDVNPERFEGEKHDHKCILCGLCVRVCDNVEKAEMLGFTKRGFGSTVEFFGDLKHCEKCGKCFDICPTGEMDNYKL